MIEFILKADERQNGYDGRNLTTHSTGAEIACLSSARLGAWFGVSRPVNSGVRVLFMNRRLIAAFLIVPWITSAVFAVVLSPYASSFNSVVIGFLLYAAFAYIAEAILGLPAFLLYRFSAGGVLSRTA
jgi:hypothetical protein